MCYTVHCTVLMEVSVMCCTVHCTVLVEVSAMYYTVHRVCHADRLFDSVCAF